jgi:hypothetical protein
MALINKNGRWLLLAAFMQMILIYVCEYFFTNDMHDAVNTMRQSLTESGMNEAQIRAVSRAIYSAGVNVSWFVRAVGLGIVLLNLAALSRITQRD